ncbi:MAG TPA: hypothetical protein VKT51_01735 [Candidatus Eremiobacteraceae bacterium]|nr:hypothetical protein [Candidatus Eremiobacteraceae bacterium]
MTHDPQRTANPSFEHLKALLGPAGVIQFARGPVPDPETGTCLDDNVRAWIVSVLALRNDAEQPYALLIGDTTVAFVRTAALPDGLFRNMADIDGNFLEAVGSEASCGRAVWACGVAAGLAPVPEWRGAGRSLLRSALPALRQFRTQHACAYAVLGLAAAAAPEIATGLSREGEPADPADRTAFIAALSDLSNRLADDFDASSSPRWSWFSDAMTWGNGRLPQALLRAAAVTENRRFAETGLRALEFLAGVTQSERIFVPIGNQGWYRAGGSRAAYAQQPIEACGMVDAWAAAYELTGKDHYRTGAEIAFDWYHGGNTERLAVARPAVGSCHDGLHVGHVNENQGAESTLSYMHAYLSIGALHRSSAQSEKFSGALAQSDV